jgi:hypothetical protein
MDDSTALIIGAAVLLVVLALIAVLATRHRRLRLEEEHRFEAERHREVAAVGEAEARRAYAEVDARVAEAKRAQAEVDEARFVAERKAQEAAEVRRRADELDPDVDLDGDTDRHDSTDRPVGDRDGLDLRDRPGARQP